MGEPRTRHRCLASLVVLIALAAGSVRWAQAAAGDDLQASVRKLEQRRDSKPKDLQTRIDLGEVYYELSRSSLDQGKQEDYLSYLRKAQTEILEATRLDPTSPEPHTWMGIITAYQGDLDAAKTSFRNALRLSQRENGGRSGGTYYSNLAHICVYQGKLSEARNYLEKAERTRAPEDELARIGILASWKENDMTEARDTFDNAAITSKQFAETWDGAKLPKPMKSFADFAEVCCKNPTCGPHMEGACKSAHQEVAKREIARETLLQEMQMERERRAQLKDIYQKRQDVQITVDDPNASVQLPGASGDAPPPSAPAQPTPATKPAAKPGAPTTPKKP